MKCIGQDPLIAELIVKELSQLQEDRQLELELARLSREARRLMRQVKCQLKDGVRELGLSFHGLSVRDRSKS